MALMHIFKVGKNNNHNQVQVVTSNLRRGMRRIDLNSDLADKPVTHNYNSSAGNNAEKKNNLGIFSFNTLEEGQEMPHFTAFMSFSTCLL